MLKQHDRVRFGDMEGIVITTSAPKPEFPIQVMFIKQKLVMAFRESGYFFEFEAGPKLKKRYPSIKEMFKKGKKHGTKMLRKRRKLDSDKST